MDIQKRIEELQAEAAMLHEQSAEHGDLVAICQVHSANAMMNEARIPDWYLGCQWHAHMMSVPQFMNSIEGMRQLLKCLRSIALCMLSSGFPEAQTFYTVADSLETVGERLYAIDQELLSLGLKPLNEGETLQ